MEEKYSTIRIVLLPDLETQRILYDLVSSIAVTKELQLKLDKNHLPHITLYFAEFPSKNVDLITKTVNEISGKTKLITLNFKELYTSWGYVGINFKITADLGKLHLLLLKKINLYREMKIRDKYQDEIDEGFYNKTQIKLIKTYGYPFVKKLYQPHINILKIDNDDEARGVLNNIKLKFEHTLVNQNYVFNKIALCPGGEHGSVTKILQQFNIAKK